MDLNQVVDNYEDMFAIDDDEDEQAVLAAVLMLADDNVLDDGKN